LPSFYVDIYFIRMMNFAARTDGQFVATLDYGAKRNWFDSARDLCGVRAITKPTWRINISPGLRPANLATNQIGNSFV
jgi:hypothetical protein